jgi:ribosomal-protein-alanine N-acetyltransferase
MSYTIRRMREEDIPQVVEIEKIAFSRPWTKSIFKAVLLLPYAAYYVAVEDGETGADAVNTVLTGQESAEFVPGKIVGVCGVKKIFEEGDISNVAVHPDYRGRGISRKMLEVLMREACEDGVQAFTLEVRAGNEIAVNLYESLGFRTEGIRPRFYDDPVEDGLIMWQRP